MVGLRVFDIGALVVWLVWFFRLRDDEDDEGGGGARWRRPRRRPDGGPPLPDAAWPRRRDATGVGDAAVAPTRPPRGRRSALTKPTRFARFGPWPAHPDPTFYASPADAAAAPAETHAYVVTLNTGTNGDRAPDALTVLDLEDGLAHLRPARRPARHAQRRRRAAPLRLERLLVGAVPVGARTRTSSAATCSCPGLRSSRIHVVDVKDDPHDPKLVKVDRGRGDRVARPATRARTRSTAGPTGSTSPRSATPRATARAASSCSTTRTSRSRAPGRTTAGRRSSPTTSGGTSTTARSSPPSGARRTWSRTACRPELLLGNQYGHKLHVWDLEKRTPRPGDRPRRRAPDGARAAARRTTRARPTGSSASSPRPPTCPPRCGCGSAPTTARVERREGDHDPAGAGRGRPAPAAPAAVRRRAAAGHRHRAVGRRPVARTSPAGAPASSSATTSRTRATRARPARCASAASSSARRTRPRARSTAARRWSRLSRDGKRVYLTNSLYAVVGRAVLPRGDRRLARQARRRRGRLADASTPTCSSSSAASGRTRCAWSGGDASSDSYCFPD